MEEIKSYDKYVEEIGKMLWYRFTDETGHIFDESGLAKFFIQDYYLNNPVKARADLMDKLDITEEDLFEL